MLHQLKKLGLTALSLSIIACGTGTTGGGQPSGRGGDSDSGIVEPAETVSIRVEATDEMLASWDKTLLRMLGPQSAYALEGLSERNDLSTTAISLVQLGPDFTPLTGGDVPEYEVIKPRDKDGYEIRFKELLVEQANLVIRVSLSNSQVIYAPLYSVANETNPLIVNVGSHFVLKKLFDQIDDIDDLNAIRTCVDENNCLNQVQAKAAIIADANELVQAYEIEIDGDLDVAAAVAFLETQADLNYHIETMVRAVTEEQSPIAKGTPRAFNLADGGIRSRLNYNVEYNSAWLGFEINNYRPAPVNATNEVLLGIGNSTIVSASQSGGPFPAYPTLNQNTSLLDVRRDSMSADIPFQRSTLLLDSGSATFTLRDDLNSFGFTGSDSFLNTKGQLLNDRILFQTINNARTFGWSFNPMFSLLYRANDFEPDTSLDNTNPDQERNYDATPTWLMSSNFSTGGRFANTSPTGQFSRGDQQEAQNLFTWEIHGQQTTDDFSSSDVNGKDYGVVSYSVHFNEGNNNRIEVYAETSNWRALGNDFFESNSNTYVLTRASDSTVSLQNASNLGLGDRDFYLVPTEEANQEFPNGGTFTRGLMGLDAGADTRGHSSEDGRHIVFSTSHPDRGRGLIIATELREESDEPIFSGEAYMLQGNTIGMDSNTNFAANLNSSRLVIADRSPSDPANIDCHATLSLSAIRVDHNLLNNTVQRASTWQAPDSGSAGPFTSTECALDGGNISMSFSNVYGNDLQLNGFVTTQGDASASDATPGRVINLVWSHADNLGLVFANLEQNLSPTFND